MVRIRRWTAVGAWILLAVVCAGSLLPETALPEDLPDASLMHFVAYAAPAALATFAAVDARRAFVAAVAILMISLSMEAAQFLIPSRSAEIMDAVFNTIGVTGGFVAGRAAVAALLRLTGPAVSR